MIQSLLQFWKTVASYSVKKILVFITLYFLVFLAITFGDFADRVKAGLKFVFFSFTMLHSIMAFWFSENSIAFLVYPKIYRSFIEKLAAIFILVGLIFILFVMTKLF